MAPVLTNCTEVISIWTCYNSILLPWNSGMIMCMCGQCVHVADPFWVWEGRKKASDNHELLLHCSMAENILEWVLQLPTKISQLPRKFIQLQKNPSVTPQIISHGLRNIFPHTRNILQNLKFFGSQLLYATQEKSIWLPKNLPVPLKTSSVCRKIFPTINKSL